MPSDSSPAANDIWQEKRLWGTPLIPWNTRGILYGGRCRRSQVLAQLGGEGADDTQASFNIQRHHYQGER